MNSDKPERKTALGANPKNSKTPTPALSPPLARVLRVVEKQPGLSIKEIAEASSATSRGATRHNLRTLIKEGYVVTHRQGNHVLHFSSKMPQTRRKSVVFLRIPSIRSFAEGIIEGPRFRTSQMARQIGITPRSVRRNLKLLEKAGLVERHPVENSKGYYDLSIHPEFRIAWVLYCKEAGRAAVPPLRRSAGWILGLELLFGKFAASSAF